MWKSMVVAAGVLLAIGSMFLWRRYGAMHHEPVSPEQATVQEVVQRLDEAAARPDALAAMHEVSVEIRARVVARGRVQPTIRKLTELLDHENEAVRYGAVLCLQEMGKDAQPAIPALLRAWQRAYVKEPRFRVGIHLTDITKEALDAIEPAWCEREDVPPAMRTIYCDTDVRLDGQPGEGGQ